MNNLTLALDTSSLTTTNMSHEEFKNAITAKVQEILEKEFCGCKEKQYIKKNRTGINFACPICHDSATDPKKKRGNMAFTGKYAGLYTCYNTCGTMKIQKFFKLFENDLDLSTINYINKQLASDSSVSYKQLSNNITSQVLNKDEALKYAIDRNYIKQVLELQDISKEATPFAYNYLIGRCQYGNFQRYLYSEKYKQIIILNLIEDKVLGMQLRNIDPNYKGSNKYLTMTIDKMRKLIYNDESEIPESILKLSCVFNIFNVDFSNAYSKPVLVAEGPFDAFLLPNCIALSGAGKNFSMSYPFWYIYDNDSTGKEHAMEALKKGYKVFMWKKFSKDYNLPYRSKWDITDVLKYMRDTNNNSKILWSPYFTNNTLDGLSV